MAWIVFAFLLGLVIGAGGAWWLLGGPPVLARQAPPAAPSPPTVLEPEEDVPHSPPRPPALPTFQKAPPPFGGLPLLLRRRVLRRRSVHQAPWLTRRRLLFAGPPHPARRLGVLARRRRLDRVEIVEVGTARARLGRVGQPDQRLGSLLRASRERLDEKHPDVHERSVVAVEAGFDEARVEAECAHPGPPQPATQLQREEDVGELGLAVAFEAAQAVGLLAGHVVVRDVGARMGVRGGRDHARRRAFLEPVLEQGGEQERCQVVDG